MHPLVIAKLTNNYILGTNFLRMHSGSIDFEKNRFSLGGTVMTIRSGLCRKVP